MTESSPTFMPEKGGEPHKKFRAAIYDSNNVFSLHALLPDRASLSGRRRRTRINPFPAEKFLVDGDIVFHRGPVGPNIKTPGLFEISMFFFGDPFVLQ